MAKKAVGIGMSVEEMKASKTQTTNDIKENNMNRFFSLHTNNSNDVTDSVITKVSEYWNVSKEAKLDLDIVVKNIADMLAEVNFVSIHIHGTEKLEMIGREHSVSSKFALGAVNRLVRHHLYSGEILLGSKQFSSRSGLHLFNNQHLEDFEAWGVGLMKIDQPEGAILPCAPIKLNAWENMAWCQINRRNGAYFASRINKDALITRQGVNDFVDLAMLKDFSVWVAPIRQWFAALLIQWVEPDDADALALFYEFENNKIEQKEHSAETKAARDSGTVYGKHKVWAGDIKTESEALGEPKEKKLAPIMVGVLGSKGTINVNEHLGAVLRVFRSNDARKPLVMMPVNTTDQNQEWWSQCQKFGYVVQRPS